MNEMLISKIEKEDIKPPAIEPGGTAIVLQRHERYDRDRNAEKSGSLFEDDAEKAKDRNVAFFQEVFAGESDGAETMVMFVSSDTQYNGKGRRSLETGQLAQDAAIDVMESLGIDPNERIINFNPNFRTSRAEETGQDIRPISHLREPQIFDNPEYVNYLRDKFGAEKGPGMGLSKEAWAAHEADTEKEAREKFGAEGVHDIVDRTKHSISVLERYARLFHSRNPGKRLVIWATSHYDTISPLVKEATGTEFTEYIPVDYGAGVVIDIPPQSKEVTLRAQNQEFKLHLGRTVLSSDRVN